MGHCRGHVAWEFPRSHSNFISFKKLRQLKLPQLLPWGNRNVGIQHAVQQALYFVKGLCTALESSCSIRGWEEEGPVLTSMRLYDFFLYLQGSSLERDLSPSSTTDSCVTLVHFSMSSSLFLHLSPSSPPSQLSELL